MTERRRVGHWTLFVVVLVAVGLRVWVVEPVRILTSSMAPNFLAGDVVLVLRGSKAEAGDVVLIEEPDGDGRRHVKRVVATGLQEVELSRGQLYVEGKRRRTSAPSVPVRWTDTDCRDHQGDGSRERAGERTWRVLTGGEHERERVPEEHLWLLGDNRGASSDSRHWGAVPGSSVRGRVWRVLWSRGPCGEIRFNRISLTGQESGGLW